MTSSEPQPESFSERVEEFRTLNRLRILREPMDAGQSKRWEELRWILEARLGGAAEGERPKRQALRVPADLAVGYSQGEQGEQHSRTHEIAERGLFLATGSPPPVGTPLCLKLNDGDTTVEVEGRVVWVRRHVSPDGPAGVGVEFAGLDEAQSEAVAFLVEEALAAL